MIRDLDAKVLANQTFQGTIYLEGDQRSVANRFRVRGLADAHVFQSTITGGVETRINFLESPAQSGINDLHNVIQDYGITEPAMNKWGKELYPRAANRLGIN